MSAEEDAELKELVIQALETNGVLAKIRAQLRASVFLALDEANTLQKKKPLENKPLQDYLATKNGKQVAYLVHEFLQYFNLDSTLSVYEPESCFGQLYFNEERQSVLREFNLSHEEGAQGPLLEKVLKKCNLSHQTPKVPQIPVGDDDREFHQMPSRHHLQVTENLEDDGEVDPFFDDPIPKNMDDTSIKSLDSEGNLSERVVEGEATFKEFGSSSKSLMSEKKETKDAAGNVTFTTSPLGSLKGAPPLGKLPPLWKDNGSVNQTSTVKSAERFHVDDYEEDFQSSASMRSDQKTGTEQSIEEDIDDNFSGIVDELLSNEAGSEAEDATTDHTVSHISTTGVDYLESIG